MSKAATFPIANPYPECVSGKPEERGQRRRDQREERQRRMTGTDRVFHDAREGSHIPNLFDSRQKPSIATRLAVLLEFIED
jgi:hypothetical protein